MAVDTAKFSSALLKAFDKERRAHDEAGRALEATAKSFEDMINTSSYLGADTILNLREAARMCRGQVAAVKVNNLTDATTTCRSFVAASSES